MDKPRGGAICGRRRADGKALAHGRIVIAEIACETRNLVVPGDPGDRGTADRGKASVRRPDQTTHVVDAFHLADKCHVLERHAFVAIGAPDDTPDRIDALDLSLDRQVPDCRPIHVAEESGVVLVGVGQLGRDRVSVAVKCARVGNRLSADERAILT